MAYLGNDLQVAYQSYKIIDDISSSFNSSLTSFPLQVGGVAPVPFPINPQQCLISVNGIVQEPDPTGTSGFNLVGSNIVFASAPTTGHSFFGVILAGADYVNIGVKYPSGSESAPSITFDTDLDTGVYNPAANELGLVTNGSDAVRINSSGDVTIGSDLIVDGDIRCDGGDVVLGTITGTKIGTATSQKIGFYNATPVVQPTTGVAEAAFVENSGSTAVNVDSTFGGYTIQQVVKALQTLGLLAQTS